MKRKNIRIISVISVIACLLTLNYFLNKSTANTPINPDCPNGCKENGDGCYCYQWYPCYKEAGKVEIQEPER